MRYVLAIALVCAALGHSACRAMQDEAQTASADDGAKTQIWNEFWHAKINLRYHVMEAADYGWYDRIWRALAFGVAVVALSGPFVYNRGKFAKGAWVAVATISVVAATIMLIWPFGDWASEHTVLAGRWNHVANEWFELYGQQEQLDPTKLEARMSELRRAVVDIESSEPAGRYKPDVMVKAEEAEKAFQGIKQEPSATAGKQALRTSGISTR